MEPLVKINDVFPDKPLKQALNESGQYVYAYYEPGGITPFYIGLGVKQRALDHWKNALKNPKKKQEIKIREIISQGKYPQIQLLAYNLDNLTEKPYELVERVLIETFGIKEVYEKFDGKERLVEVKNESTLLQIKNENKSTPPLTLDAAIAKLNDREEFSAQEFQDWANSNGLPILLVGLSKTYKTSYQSDHLGEMARMYWNLNKFSNTTLPGLKSAPKACLLAWSSKAGKDKVPMIVGAWQIDGTKSSEGKNGRFEFPTTENFDFRRQFLGCRLSGTGNNWQGPRIYTPDDS
jgi:hypothetical protein